MKEESLLLLSDLQKLINQVVLIDYTIIILGGKCLIDLKADQDEIKEVLGNEYQDYNLERYQQTVIHRIANVDSKVIIST